MAEATEFNLESGIEAKRKQLMTLVNVGTTEPKVWQLLGTGIADSAIEKNGDKTKVTDILGVTRARLNKTEPSQTFTPYTVTGDDELRLQLHNHYRNDRYSELSNSKSAALPILPVAYPTVLLSVKSLPLGLWSYLVPEVSSKCHKP